MTTGTEATHGDADALLELEALLDRVSPWTDADWRALWERERGRGGDR